ncbi:hypothetical protein [Pseudomonas matsuisoli]|uniref:Uncharacterized protein n=1 Tax=Pseudomonas matsuisoli TaxID=1515666 RepID=A0A917PR00_9PSED|nr:hypothetical protein [Pseudomonas matsuisoli]GGJ88427.1 hypothetical protein GCM10009304_12660 [Pseudomonas matsuisoli]
MIAAIDLARSESALKQVEQLKRTLELLWEVEESEGLISSIKDSCKALSSLHAELKLAVMEARGWAALETELTAEGIAYRKELERIERIKLVGNGN